MAAKNVIGLARRLSYTPMGDQRTLMSIVKKLEEALAPLDTYLPSISGTISEAYEEATLAYATLCINPLDTELEHLLTDSDLAKKAEHAAKKTYEAAKLARTEIGYN